jgi:hypothetical protein
MHVPEVCPYRRPNLFVIVNNGVRRAQHKQDICHTHVDEWLKKIWNSYMTSSTLTSYRLGRTCKAAEAAFLNKTA